MHRPDSHERTVQVTTSALVLRRTWRVAYMSDLLPRHAQSIVSEALEALVWCLSMVPVKRARAPSQGWRPIIGRAPSCACSMTLPHCEPPGTTRQGSSSTTGLIEAPVGAS